ncbi:hypothetical protein, partial [Mediterraneibacter gnavus]|nr:hypothetical protein [Mediterraneibacter gnavus]
MVLFGGSIIAGGDILAEAIQNEVAKKNIIVGGAGNTTETLRNVAGATDYFRPLINDFLRKMAKFRHQ